MVDFIRNYFFNDKTFNYGFVTRLIIHVCKVELYIYFLYLYVNQNINEAYLRIENNLKIRTRFNRGKEDYDIYACNTCTCMYLLI